MMNLVSTIAIVALGLVAVGATRVQDCQTGEDFADATQVTISNCEEPPCRLRRKTEVAVELKFKPENDIKSLRNGVNANIVGIPFPFIGVDGTNACDNVFNVDGSKASCPLTGGTEYVYKNAFKILEIYPKIKLTVHWALVDSTTSKNTACFNVDAKITS